MKEIPLTQGKLALVDDEDYQYLSQFKWCAHNNYDRTYYAIRWNKGVVVRMHRVITNCPDGMEVDHIDGNGLNNQRNNLRVVTCRENNQNRHIKKTSKYPGVYWNKPRKKWLAHIRINGKYTHLGLFIDEYEAYLAYKSAVERVDGTKLLSS